MCTFILQLSRTGHERCGLVRIETITTGVMETGRIVLYKCRQKTYLFNMVGYLVPVKLIIREMVVEMPLSTNINVITIIISK